MVSTKTRRTEGSNFRLTKWYLDCVAVDGTVVIGYAARLHLHGVSVPFMQVLLSRPGHPRRSHRSWTDLQTPVNQNGGFVWRVPTLGVDARWELRSPPVRRMLLDTAEGAVEWRCHLPCGPSHVSLQRDALEVDGLGCVEELEISIPPWKLPIESLRWGHFVSSNHDMTWIDWSGPHPLTLAFLDGVEQLEASVEDHHIDVAGGPCLKLLPGRELRSGAVSSEIHLPPALARLVPGIAGAMFEHKWLSRGVLELPSDHTVEGWAIHERVRFR